MSATAIQLAVRDRRPERMDAPDLDPAAHRAALRGLALVNRISRTVPRLWRVIRRECAPKNEPLRILDAGCGGGDVTIGLSKRARRDGRPVAVVGCDTSGVAIDFAQSAARRRRAEVAFVRRDLLAEGVPDEFDVVCCSLFLHHLSDEEAVAFLKQAGRGGRLVVVGDLVRCAWGYHLAWWGTRLLSRSSIVHHDGPVSVRAAFTTGEARALAERAGLTQIVLERHWPARFLLTAKGSGDAVDGEASCPPT